MSVVLKIFIYLFFFFLLFRTDHRRGFDATADEGTQLCGRNTSGFTGNRRPRKIQTVLGQTRVIGFVGVFRFGTVLEKRVHGRQQQQYQSTRKSILFSIKIRQYDRKYFFFFFVICSRFWNSWPLTVITVFHPRTTAVKTVITRTKIKV